MKYKKISVSVDRKVSDNNFGSYGAVVTLEVELEDGDKASDVIAKLQKRAEAELVVTLDNIRANKALKPKTKKD